MVTTRREQDSAHALASLLLMVVLWLPLALFNGWVTSRLWDWFISPVTRWPEINVWQAAGLSLFITWAVMQPFDRDPDARIRTAGETLGVCLGVVVAGLAALTFGWVYLQLAGGGI